MVELAIERAHSLAHHFGDVASAASLIEEVLPAVTDEHLRVSVEVALAELTGWGGHMADAVVLSEAVLQRPDLDADAALSATSLLVFARAQTGPFDVLASLVVEGRKLVKATKGEARIYALWLYAGEFNHAFFARDLSAATIIARRYQSPDSSPEVPDDFRAVGAVTEAMASVFSGRSIDATGQLAQGRALLGDADPYELVAYLEAMSAIVSAHRGDERVLAKRVDRFLEQRHGRTTHSAGIADYAIAHLEAIRNGPKAGVAVARERANQTITVDGTLSWASLSLLLGPRLGEPGQVVDDLASVADAIGGVLVPCGASHARALIDRDGDALIECAQTYGRAGFLLFAAEAAEQAAIVAMTEGSEVPAARFRLLRDRWLLSCQPFWSTTLTDIKPVITARERDVLSPIAEGLTTRECAELLFLSAKTVENHLGRMYRRFGVGGRAELLSLVDTLN
ncbi:MAG: helix-turn-helix transcriptional regulator [Acidimicrobiales bacterium]